MTGTYGGTAVPTTETIGLYGVNTAAGTYAGAFVSNLIGSCALVQSANPQARGLARPSTTQLAIQVVGINGPVSAGTYPIGLSGDAGYVARATMEVTDAQCENTALTSDASSGTIKLEDSSSMLVTGTFDLVFPSGDHLTGEFYAPVCNFDLSSLQHYGLSSCAAIVDAGAD